MGKFAALVWVVLAPTLMGVCVMIVLFIPAFAHKQMQMMLPAVGIGALIAIPFSILIAKRIHSRLK